MVFGEINTMYEEVKDRIKEHEGFKLEPYQLSYRTKDGKKVKEDFWTGGYGHKLSKDEEVPTTKEGWDLLFEKDFEEALKQANHFIDKDKIKFEAFTILIEMSYQMGSSIHQFKNLKMNLEDQNYVLASDSMMDSKWANQTPSRASWLSLLMRDL
jgi:GH24 family phage-related lysozyme (muramidase)